MSCQTQDLTFIIYTNSGCFCSRGAPSSWPDKKAIALWARTLRVIRERRMHMKKVKITILKTTLQEDLAKEYGIEGLTACPMMKEG